MKNHKDLTEHLETHRMLEDFIITCSPWNKGQHDYGNKHMMNFTEAHTLQHIIEHPGLIASDIADYWGFTLCAASKIVSSLHAKGLVKKEKEEGNQKNLYLIPTELGLECNQLHQGFDKEYYTILINTLSTIHSKEELDIFFLVMPSYINCARQIMEKRGILNKNGNNKN